MFKTIDECLEFVMSQRNSFNELEVLSSVFNEIGPKYELLKIIHVAGTNGKGSTVNYIMSSLKELGFKVGTMQSPHLLTHLDRIRINNENIDADYFLKKVNEYLDIIERYKLSMFSIDYLVMCDYFIDNHVDYAVIEVGIGGRLDNTNVIKKPLISVITSIGFDHMDKLGNTLAEITYEKAGIIKNNSHTVIGKLDKDLMKIVADICTDKNNELTFADDYEKLDICRFRYKENNYSIKSHALYQFDNAAIAIETVNTLAKIENFKIDQKKMVEGINKAFWEGRYQIIGTSPMVIVDGAHNTHGIRALCETIKTITGKKNVVFSALKDKKYQEMLNMLNDYVDHITITTFDNYRLFDTNSIELTSKMDIEEDCIKAINTNIKDGETLIIAGSLYFVSTVLEYKNQGLINVSR